jgi:hypothetical protein
MRLRMSYKTFLQLMMYALVPVLTFGIEDTYLTEMLGQVPAAFQFPLAPSSGITLCDIGGIVLLGLAVPLMARRENRRDLKIFALFAIAILVSGLYGLIRGASSDYALFEPSVWKTLVHLVGFTIIFNRIFAVEADRERFLSWFCLLQFIFGALALADYFAGGGHVSYFGANVPIFAGDMLIFVIIAFAICLFRLTTRITVWRLFGLGLFMLLILMSLRRSFIIPVISAPMLLAMVFAIHKRKLIRWIPHLFILTTLFLATIWIFYSYAGAWQLPTEFVIQRIKSINPFWADSQSEQILTSMGHTDDFFDGWETAIKSPILGQGLAVWFPNPRTSSWQNANIHAGIFKIWIKLGLIGVIAYLILFSRGITFFSALRIDDACSSMRLFVVWFSLHFLIVSIYMNSILFGYKNAFVTALYLALCTNMLSERIVVSEKYCLHAKSRYIVKMPSMRCNMN